MWDTWNRHRNHLRKFIKIKSVLPQNRHFQLVFWGITSTNLMKIIVNSGVNVSPVCKLPCIILGESKYFSVLTKKVLDKDQEK